MNLSDLSHCFMGESPFRLAYRVKIVILVDDKERPRWMENHEMESRESYFRGARLLWAIRSWNMSMKQWLRNRSHYDIMQGSFLEALNFEVRANHERGNHEKAILEELGFFEPIRSWNMSMKQWLRNGSHCDIMQGSFLEALKWEPCLKAKTKERNMTRGICLLLGREPLECWKF